MGSWIRHEGFYSLPKHSGDLFYQTWQKDCEPKVWVIVTHGQGEHSERYYRLAEGLRDLPIGLIGWDLRGHGRSFGKRGWAADFLDYVQDLNKLANDVFLGLTANKPRFWLGHSMGGLIVLRWMLEAGAEFKKDPIILSSPFLGLSLDVPAWKRLGARTLNYLAPSVCLDNEITVDLLTRDPEVVEEYKKDPFIHHKISASVFLGALKTQNQVFHSVHLFQNPLLLQIATHDPIVSSIKNRLFFTQYPAQDKALKDYPERKHEIYNDLDREAVFADLKDWILKHL